MNEQLRELIARVRRRWLLHASLRSAGLAAAAAAAPALAGLIAERLLDPEDLALVMLAGVTILLSVGMAAAVLWRLRRVPDDRHVARFIEERAGSLPDADPMDEALVSAVEVVEAPERAPVEGFAALIVDAAIRRLEQIPADAIVTAQAVRRSWIEAASGAAVLAVAAVLAAPFMMRAADTARVRFFPGSIAFDVSPGNTRVPAGTPVRIRAVVRGGAEVIARFPPSLTVAAGGEQRTVRMIPAEGAFEVAIDSVDRTFTYQVTAGSAASRPYEVTALFPPRVRRIDLHYAYPSFSGLKPRDEEDGGDIYAPAGTRVRMRIHTEDPIAAGELAMGRAAAGTLTLRQAGERLLEADLVLNRDDSYRIRLADADGLRSDGDTEYFIRIMDDRPPDVRILRPSADQSITPLEEVAIEARADDDYGISRFELVYSVAGGAERVVPFQRTGGTGIQRVGSRLLAAEELGVKPGDVVSYYARAWDVGRGKRPTLARSDIFFLEVKPFSEEFVAAQSQAGGGGSRAGAQIEALIAAQKEIISATWNVERRSGGGVSEGDLAQIAQAQAELRQRVEQLAARANPGRGRGRLPERIAPQLREPQGRAAAADPIAAAIEAMARALQQLESRKTKEALPHEMAALNGLLEAQAEVRRREVARAASASGSGGSNRSEQDLSALFDRELQRQQRTNYENRSQVEERPERNDSGSSAADRIRDLARRQEDLSRRQRDLANAGLSADEMKRQLERLTREQQELREQAEELLRQSRSDAGREGRQEQRGQQGQASGQSQRSADQSSGMGNSGMRGASEQMRNALGELGREDPARAAQSGERAAEHLRRLEEQMRGSSAGSRERAAGELQLEAQQIAQEQRRIAAEAERLDKAQGNAGADARRRLAEEKERLAGRVDQLQRAAEAQARQDPKAGEAGAMSEAARQIEKEQIGRRMRDSATQLRDGAKADGASPGKPGADTEQQLARALDKVVDTMGGTASAEARQLSDRLDETRGMRDRLNRLEQQIREAEARQRDGRQGQPGRQGREGQQGTRGASGGGQGGGELQRLQEEYQRELQRTREALGQLASAQPRDGMGSSTPEQHEFSRSAPGTESFKQDRGGWESLRKDVDLALEQYEAAVSDRLARKQAQDRLSAGGSQRVPDGYRRQVARYYESLAKVKK